MYSGSDTKGEGRQKEDEFRRTKITQLEKHVSSIMFQAWLMGDGTYPEKNIFDSVVQDCRQMNVPRLKGMDADVIPGQNRTTIEINRNFIIDYERKLQLHVAETCRKKDDKGLKYDNTLDSLESVLELKKDYANSVSEVPHGIRIFLNQNQVQYHQKLIFEFCKNEMLPQSQVCQFLCIPVGSGKTRVAFSIIVRMLLEGRAKRAVYIYKNQTESFLLDEFDLCLKDLSSSYQDKMGLYSTSKVLNYGDLNTTANRWTQFIKDWSSAESTIRIFFVSSGLLNYSSPKGDASVLKKYQKGNCLVVVDECHSWLKLSNHEHQLIHDWKPEFQLYMSATMVPNGFDSINEIVNKGILQRVGLNQGRLSNKLKYLECLKIRNLSQKSVAILQRYYNAIWEARNEYLRGSAGSALCTDIQKRAYTCPQPVEQYIVFIRPSDKMMEEYIKIKATMFSAKERHETEFLQTVCTLQRVLSPQEEVPCVKTKLVLKSVLKFFIKEGKRKVLIVSHYKTKLKNLQKTIANDPSFKSLCEGLPSIIIGGASDKFRNDQIKRYNEEEGCTVLLMTINLAIGLNLQMASAIIFLEPSWNNIAVEQAVGRIARTGQQREVMAVMLVYENTVETGICNHGTKKQWFWRFIRGQDETPKLVEVPLSGDCKEDIEMIYVQNNDRENYIDKVFSKVDLMANSAEGIVSVLKNMGTNLTKVYRYIDY